MQNVDKNSQKIKISEEKMREYDFSAVEKKWQDRWVADKTFKAIDFHPTKPKFYVLYEFFNISGNLHMGHLKGTVPADALARYKRLKGYNVLFPIGGDAFGLPAENAAIKRHINPEDFVRNGMQIVTEQSRRLGLSFDWDRTFATSDPEFYRWTQWIFLQLLKHGKAYKQNGKVNFCNTCKTVLSNEDSQNGVCDRCGNPVEQVERSVWFLKMQEYSEKLLGNVERINMVEKLKEEQRNWIGKSEGMTVAFPLVSGDKKIGQIEIYTTCIETIFGVTFVTLAPENALIEEISEYIVNFDEVKKYQEETRFKSELMRKSNINEKTGVKLEGIFAINPITRDKVPVFSADFVLAGYGSGAVMAVPCHDQRDYDFAKAHNIEMKQVIEGDCSEHAVEKREYLEAKSHLINSGEFSGLEVSEAKNAIIQKIIAGGFGHKTTNFKMKDWPFNRQRYWGEPFPVVFCSKCGIVPLDEADLPLKLPHTDDYLPGETGDSPLSKIPEWVNCTCPKCGGSARHETDTMPNWAGSSWYWLRYCDPHNDKALADLEKLKYWGSVDVYTGGTEHITRHVLYAFFWQNFLYEIGAVPSRDPFVRKMGSGLILDSEGKKMSKSSANGVSPMEVVDKYGSDVARMHLNFLSGYEDNVAWTYEGISGITSFINRVWNLPEILKGEGVSREHIFALNKLNKKIQTEIEDLKLNTIIAGYMTFIKMIREDGFITREELRQFLIMLNPIAPHITSEMYEEIFGKLITDESWPDYDEKYLVELQIQIPLQLNGKLKKVLTVDKDSNQDAVENTVRAEFPDLLDGAKKVVFVPNKIINIIK